MTIVLVTFIIVTSVNVDIVLLQTATISMFSCLGQEALAIRDSYIARLSARSEVGWGTYSTILVSSILPITGCQTEEVGTGANKVTGRVTARSP